MSHILLKLGMCFCRLEGDLTQLKTKQSASEQLNEKAAAEHAAELAEVKDAAGKALSAERRTVRKLTNCLSHSAYEKRR